MSREVTPNRAAKMMRINRKTVLQWCHAALDGEASVLAGAVTRTPTGRFLIDGDTVRKVREGIL